MRAIYITSCSYRLFEIYRDRGVKIVQEPEDRPWGLRQFIIEDCNAYLVSFSAELPGGGSGSALGDS